MGRLNFFLFLLISKGLNDNEMIIFQTVLEHIIPFVGSESSRQHFFLSRLLIPCKSISSHGLYTRPPARCRLTKSTGNTSSENPEDHLNVPCQQKIGSSFLLCFLVLSNHLDPSSEDCLFKHNYNLAGLLWLCVSFFVHVIQRSPSLGMLDQIGASY